MNIVNMVTSFATPMVANKIASALGLPEADTRKVLTATMPLLLAMLLKRGTAPGGTQALGAAMAGLGPNPLPAFGKLFQGDPSKPALTAAAQGGTDIVATLFGTAPAATAAAKLSAYGGIEPTAASALLGLGGTAVLAGLRQAADDHKLDAGALVAELVRERADIAKALPADIAQEVEGTGLVDDTLFTAAAATFAAPVAAGGNSTPWLIALIALVAAGVAAYVFLAPEVAPPTAPAPAEAPPAAPAPTAPAAPEPAAPAAVPEATVETELADAPAVAPPPAAPDADTSPDATPEAAAPAPVVRANPLVVDGVDVGSKFQEVISALTATLGSVSDATTAEAALGRLREADITLDGLKGPVERLPAEGHAALKGQLGNALPTLRATSDRLLADAAIGPVIRPVIADVMTKLNGYAG